jgi:rhodanese-related sulfurtransferase
LYKNYEMDLIQEEWAAKYDGNQNAVILDVRTESEYSEGYIPNAINININEAHSFISQVEQLDKSKEYFIYCRSGVRSARACEVMENLGFDVTFNLLGGILDWDGEIV